MASRSIVIQRLEQTRTHTLGRLTVKGSSGADLYECVCLELPWRNNLPRTSCVPAGRYPIVLEWSPAFKMDLWELKDVPGRSEVKIHAANYVAQLWGCIAPGLKASDLNGDGTIDVSDSRIALVRLMAAMGDVKAALIEIRDPFKTAIR